MKGDFLTHLESVRQTMIESGMKYGLCNERTIRLSIEFDQLMNEYLREQAPVAQSLATSIK